MPSIAELLDKQAASRDVTISSEGYVLWLCWNGEQDPTIPQTLQDYGGLNVLNGTGQSLWFFFSNDILLALAKLVVWGKFNPLSMHIQAFPGILQVAVGQVISLQIEPSLTQQNLPEPTPGLRAWVHPRLKALGANIPGLDYKKEVPLTGMTNIEWTQLFADPRLPYTSSQGWYAILRPLGNPLDRSFQNGWRTMFAAIEQIVQTQKFKYSLHDNYLMVPLENLRQLRLWVHELLYTVLSLKERSPDHYWPCVSVIVDRRGLNFNNELPSKVNVYWDNLMPDFPYMSYRNGYLLGEGFAIQDLHFSSSNTSMDSWCNVSLTEVGAEGNRLPILMSGQLIGGVGTGCYYCGVRTHDPAQCPSRKMPPLDGDFWKNFGTLDIDDLNAAFRTIDQKLTTSGIAGYNHLLNVADSPESLVLQGVFAINHGLQLRSIERIWLLSGKDIQAQSEEQAYRDDSVAWGLLERLSRIGPNELASFEKEMQSALVRAPRDWHLRSLMGFVSMERGDLTRALSYWHDAESLCTSVLHQAWHCFLKARGLELQARFTDAMEAYGTVRRLLPTWKEAEYRFLVCRVKMGFAEQVQERFVEMVTLDSSMFNRFLLDPELERGQKPLLTALYPLWADAQKLCNVERTELMRISKELDAWFPEGHPVASKFVARLESLLEESNVKNYLAFLGVLKVRPMLEEEIGKLIQREIEELQERFKGYLSTLEIIRDEASWFPMPRALVEFNKDFNECATILNWAFASDFRTPEAFKKAQSHIPTLEEILKRLEKRLRMLRVIRDATLFVLILIRSFMWTEVIGLLLCFIGVFALSMYGADMGLLSLERLIRGNFWELQKVLVSIVSVTALGIASLRTTLVFEQRREQMLEEARTQREALQRRRLDRIRQTKEAAQRNLDMRRASFDSQSQMPTVRSFSPDGEKVE